jgi:hypothetical protein
MATFGDCKFNLPFRQFVGKLNIVDGKWDNGYLSVFVSERWRTGRRSPLNISSLASPISTNTSPITLTAIVVKRKGTVATLKYILGDEASIGLWVIGFRD